MGLKVFTTDFAELAQDAFFRNDEKYHCFLNSTKWNLFESKKTNLISLKDILKSDYEGFIFEDDEEYKGIPTGQSYIDEDGDIIDFQTITKEKHPTRLKYKVSNENILISSLRFAKSPALYFENEDLSNFVFSNGFYVFKVNENWNRRLILNILRNKRLKHILDNNIYRGIGISAYKEDDLLKIKIPQIPKEIQDQIVTQIVPIEQKIKELKNQIQPTQEIINKIFVQKFGFDLVKFEKLKTHTIFYLDFASFANNIDLRQSVKFHREAGKFVLEQLKSKTNKKIKDFLSEPIVLGKGISPSEYDENGDVFYIAMSNIKNWQFETEEAKTVSSIFANANKNKMVALNDILLARSGEGTIGKVALIDDKNVEGIFADFTMRIRLKDYNYLFAYFYFRTTYFQYLVEINKKGLGNNTNIFPSQVQEFPLFDISLIEQQQIVDEIKAELYKQESAKKAIAGERNKIDEIIENSIRDL
jgi:type I restriction enzyme S subunit